MMVSTRGRYALQVMIDLAEQESDGYIPLKDISLRQEISLKYLESIMCLLSRNQLVQGVHGKGGGYRLLRTPEEYSIGEILRITEGDLAPVGCLECHAEPCSRSDECKSFPVWNHLHTLINNYLDSVTLADILNGSCCEGPEQER